MGLLDWLTDPNRTQQLQGLGNNLKGAIEQLKQHRGLLDAAVSDSRKYGLLADTPANRAYNESVATGVVNSIGPLSVKGKFVYPQEKALLTAQKNAALPVEQGGLGLRPDNTPMERAQAMGYTDDVFHKTKRDFTEFKSGGYDPRISGDAIWTGSDPTNLPAAHNVSDAKEGARVLPLVAKSKNPLLVDDKTMLDFARNAYADGSQEFPQVMPKQWADELRKDYDSVDFKGSNIWGNGAADEKIFFSPNQLRSRFAAFDPMRKSSPDILAGLLPLSSIADDESRNKILGLLGSR